jgi:glycosyltransferase involved in cell wall biosynthesis
VEPLVSILIPCYNAERWIVDALQSTQRQDWDNTEIILVDDGSKDASVAVVKSLGLPRIKIICQENQGSAMARNRALKEAQGDFIQWFDADDILGAGKIKRQMRLLMEKKPGVIASGEWARFWRVPDEARFIPERLWRDYDPIDWLVCAWNTGTMMQPGAWLVPRAVTERAGPWNSRCGLNDDGEYFCRVVLASQGVKFCPEARVYYRSGNPDSLCNRYSHLEMERCHESIVLSSAHLLQREESSRTRCAAATLFRQFVYWIYIDKSMRDIVEKAEAEVQRLGGTELKPGGGPLFQCLVSVVGWRRALDLKYLFQASVRQGLRARTAGRAGG